MAVPKEVHLDTLDPCSCLLPDNPLVYFNRARSPPVHGHAACHPKSPSARDSSLHQWGHASEHCLSIHISGCAVCNCTSPYSGRNRAYVHEWWNYCTHSYRRTGYSGCKRPHNGCPVAAEPQSPPHWIHYNCQDGVERKHFGIVRVKKQSRQYCNVYLLALCPAESDRMISDIRASILAIAAIRVFA